MALPFRKAPPASAKPSNNEPNRNPATSFRIRPLSLAKHARIAEKSKPERNRTNKSSLNEDSLEGI
jgi:hypothetical protein